MQCVLVGIDNLALEVYHHLNRYKNLSKIKNNASVKVTGVFDIDQAKMDIDLFKDLKKYQSFEQILEDENVDTVTIFAGDVMDNKKMIEQALSAKKNVVAATNEALSIYHKALIDIAINNQVDLYYDGALSGGMAITSFINSSLASDKIIDFKAIINGTNNFILSTMLDNDLDVNVGLMQASTLGYAEKDPQDDLNGFEPARKLALIASAAYTKNIIVDDVFIKGIEKVNRLSLNVAKRLGYEIKHLAIASELTQGIVVAVLPAFVKNTHQLAYVDDINSAIYFTSEQIGHSMIYSPGTGVKNSAVAIVNDLLQVANNIENDYCSKSLIVKDDNKNIITEQLISEFIFIGDKDNLIALNDEIGNILIDDECLVNSVSLQKAYEYEEKYQVLAYPLVA